MLEKYELKEHCEHCVRLVCGLRLRVAMSGAGAEAARAEAAVISSEKGVTDLNLPPPPVWTLALVTRLPLAQGSRRPS